jgi:cyanophycinase
MPLPSNPMRNRLAALPCLALALVLAAMLAALLPASALAAETRAGGAAGSTQGTVVAIGGALRDDNAAVWSRVVQLAGGTGSRYVVLATASGEPQASAAAIVANLQRHGALAVALPVAPLWPGVDATQASADPQWLEAVARSQGVFFSGGAQARLLDTLQPGGQATPLLEAVRALLARGGVVAGTSSGAAVLSTLAFRDAPDVLAALQGRLRDGAEVDRGFGFLRPSVVVDQHFVRRGRIGRLLPLMLSRGAPLGLGVEEDSAAIVQGDAVEAIGSRGVLVVDLGAARSDASLGAFNVMGARLSWLNSGDRFDLATGTLAPAPARRAGRLLDPGSAGFKPTHRGPAHFNDMLGEGVLVVAMARLVDSDQAQVSGLAFNGRPAADDPRASLGFEWRLSRDVGTLGWAGPQDAEPTMSKLRLDVQPVRLASPLHGPWKP